MASDSKWYSVTSGNKTGVFSSWEECKANVAGVDGAKFKIFPTEDAAYEHFCSEGSSKPAKPAKKVGAGVRKAELKAMKMKHYAVAAGRKPGVYSSHPEMMEQVKGFDDAKFKVFETANEANAWIVETQKKIESRKAIYAAKATSSTAKATSSSAPTTTKGSFYAVKYGRKPGIYSTWAECKAQIDKFSGAVHMKCSTMEEALKFVKVAENRDTAYTYRIFTDGGCREGKAGYAMAVYKDNKLIYESYGPVMNFEKQIWSPSTPDSEKQQTNNVAELCAVYEALCYLEDNEIKECEIIADSKYSIDCIESYYPAWSLVERKTKENARLIAQCVDSHRVLCDEGLDLKFTHIGSHDKSSDPDSDVSHNNYVDELATKGLMGETAAMDK